MLVIWITNYLDRLGPWVNHFLPVIFLWLKFFPHLSDVYKELCITVLYVSYMEFCCIQIKSCCNVYRVLMDGVCRRCSVVNHHPVIYTHMFLLLYYIYRCSYYYYRMVVYYTPPSMHTVHQNMVYFATNFYHCILKLIFIITF